MNSNKVKKGIFVVIFAFLMYLPLFLVQNLVKERQLRKDGVVNEISQKWSGPQKMTGLFIEIPYQEQIVTIEHVKGKNFSKTEWEQSSLFLTPKSMSYVANIDPESRRVGIYKAVVYKSQFKIDGFFDPYLLPNKDKRKYDLSKAKILFGIEDPRGLSEDISLNFNGQKIDLGNDDRPKYLSKDLNIIDLETKEIKFDMVVSLKGSTTLSFVPMASTTKVSVNAKWESPSFYGSFLPTYVLDKKGFKANWTVLELNRNISRTLSNITENNWDQYAFGIKLIETGNNYLKNERATKYGILIIALSFLAFFFIELLMGQNVNYIQYGLVGLALVIFYCLLLSISEILMFNWAYLISSFATIGLIYAFSKSLFTNAKSSLAIASLLSILYGFIFVIIQLEDTALLIGSIGLFIILAFTMYFSKKINWEN